MQIFNDNITRMPSGFTLRHKLDCGRELGVLTHEHTGRTWLIEFPPHAGRDERIELVRRTWREALDAIYPPAIDFEI